MFQYLLGLSFDTCTALSSTYPGIAAKFVRFEIFFEGAGFEEVPLDETNLLVSTIRVAA